jgi:hypothetical protein
VTLPDGIPRLAPLAADDHFSARLHALLVEILEKDKA